MLRKQVPDDQPVIMDDASSYMALAERLVSVEAYCEVLLRALATTVARVSSKNEDSVLESMLEDVVSTRQDLLDQLFIDMGYSRERVEKLKAEARASLDSPESPAV